MTTDLSTLPPGWEWTTIGDVAEVQLGRQRSPQHHRGEQMRPYLRSANVTWDGISLDDVKEMNFDDSDFEKYRLEAGDLLMQEAGDGRPAIWNGNIEDCCFQNTLLRLRPLHIDRSYLFRFCYYAALSGQFADAGRGVTISHLGKRGLSQFPIPVPPLGEQREIVDRLEEYFSRLDAAEASLEEAARRCQTLRRRIISDAFHADTDLPIDWEWRTLGDVAEWGSGGTPRRSESHYFDGDIPWVLSGDLRDQEIRTISQSISKAGLENSNAKLIAPGSVLIAMIGATIGKLGILRTAASCNQNVAFAKPYIDTKYLFYYLMSQRDLFRSSGLGSAQRNLSQTLLKSWPIPICAPKDQARIIEALEEHFSRLNAAEPQIQRAITEGKALRRSILAAAFSGRLTSEALAACPPLQVPASVNDWPPASAWAT